MAFETRSAVEIDEEVRSGVCPRGCADFQIDEISD